MNNTYFNKDIFPQAPFNQGNTLNQGNMQTPVNTNYNVNTLPLDQSYIGNILRLNKGKQVRVYMTFPDSNDFRDRELYGIIEQSGRDHIILSEPSTGKWQLLPMAYIDYITFDENINYSSDFLSM